MTGGSTERDADPVSKPGGRGLSKNAPSDHGFETLAIHAGNTADPLTGAVVPPIYQVSTYKQDGVGGLRGGYEYSRSANPTRTALEQALAALEGGVRGLAFASGLAAEDTLLRTVCQPGDHLILPGAACRPRRRARRRSSQHEGVVVRDADQPAARHRRHRRARHDRTGCRGAA